MRATVIYGAGDVRVEDVPDPKVKEATDAVVRVVRSCICGSDLWPYSDVGADRTRQADRPRLPRHSGGHRFRRLERQVGRRGCRTIRVLGTTLASFCVEACLYTSCVHGGFWGAPEDREVADELRRFVAAHLVE